MFIFEGPDGSGKTTLARDLERQGYTYSHEGPPPAVCPDLIEHYAQKLLKAKRNTVFDRLYLGETIYGPILRGNDRISGELGVNMLNQLVWALGGRTIIFLPGLTRSWLNMKNRKGELISEYARHEAVYAEYERWAEHEDMLFGTYNYSKDFGHLGGPNPLPRGMVGHFTAQTIFVGDVANSKTLDLPFFSTEGSSLFLRECLRRAGYRPQDYILVNANKIDGSSWDVEDMVENYWHPTKRPVIVALGNNAADAVSNIVDRKLNHPAYQKRFRSSETEAYIRELALIRERGRKPSRSLA